MYTKNAFKNLKNRYKAVLKKCNLLNTFGSLAIASTVLMSAVMPHLASASSTEDLLTEYLEASSSSVTDSTAYSYIKVESNGNFSLKYYDESGAEQELNYNVYDANGNIITSTDNRITILSSDVNANFIGNYTSGSFTAYGGAIYNSYGTIGNITASFIGNYASTGGTLITTTSYGGAIYNSHGTIKSITGLFIGNYVYNSYYDTYGGAIYNSYGTIGSISGSFIGNYASSGGASNSTTSYGGAIFNHTASLTFLANSQTHLFTDNYTISNGTTKDYNFITSLGGSLTFTMTGTGGFILNDSIIKDSNAYTLTITGENKNNNIFYINDTISGFDEFTVSNATLRLGYYEHMDETDIGITVTSTTGGSFIADSSSTSSTMTFTNAKLCIDLLASDYIENTGNIFLNGSNVSTFTADANSSLFLQNTSLGGEYDIASGFDSSSIWFTQENVSANALFEVSRTTGDTGSSLTVKVESVKEINSNNAIYNTPSAGLLYDTANSSVYIPNSTNTGARFIYTVMDDFTTSDAQKIQLVEGAMQMGAVAGVQKILATTISSANTVLDTRMLNTNSINPTSMSMRVVHKEGYDEEGHVTVYDNISTVASNGNSYGVLASPKNYTEVWLMPMYAHENISGISSGNFSNTGYTSDMYGVALGIDRTFQDKYRIGLAFDVGYGSSESNGDYARTQNDFDFFGFTAYGSVRFDKLSILGSVGYTKNDSEVAQDLSAYSLNNLYSDIKSEVWNFNIKAEYNYAFGKGYNLAPYLGVQYMSMSTDDYKVKDSNSVGSGTYGSTVFNVKSDRQDVFSFPVGVALSKDFYTENDWDFTPKVNAGVIFATGDLYATTVSSVPDIDASSSMSLKVIDSTTLDLGLGLSATRENFTMMFDYDFQYSEHRTAHGVMGKVVFKF